MSSIVYDHWSIVTSLNERGSLASFSVQLHPSALASDLLISDIFWKLQPYLIAVVYMVLYDMLLSEIIWCWTTWCQYGSWFKFLNYLNIVIWQIIKFDWMLVIRDDTQFGNRLLNLQCLSVVIFGSISKGPKSETPPHTFMDGRRFVCIQNTFVSEFANLLSMWFQPWTQEPCSRKQQNSPGGD